MRTDHSTSIGSLVWQSLGGSEQPRISFAFSPSFLTTIDAPRCLSPQVWGAFTNLRACCKSGANLLARYSSASAEAHHMTNLNISEGRCQFCHGVANDVRKLIAGDSAFICEDCVQACVSLLKPNAPSEREEKQPMERYLYKWLGQHVSPMRPQEMIATSRVYPLRQQADLQKALDDLFGERRVPENFLGVHQQYRHEALV